MAYTRYADVNLCSLFDFNILVHCYPGTNLQALLDHTLDPSTNSQAEIVLVVSNKQDAVGLRRAEAAGVSTRVR